MGGGHLWSVDTYGDSGWGGSASVASYRGWSSCLCGCHGNLCWQGLSDCLGGKGTPSYWLTAPPHPSSRCEAPHPYVLVVDLGEAEAPGWSFQSPALGTPCLLCLQTLCSPKDPGCILLALLPTWGTQDDRLMAWAARGSLLQPGSPASLEHTHLPPFPGPDTRQQKWQELKGHSVPSPP